MNYDKMISFKATKRFTDELTEFCNKWRLSKSALIRMLVYVFIRKVDERSSTLADWIHDMNDYQKGRL